MTKLNIPQVSRYIEDAELVENYSFTLPSNTSGTIAMQHTVNIPALAESKILLVVELLGKQIVILAQITKLN